MNTIMNTLRPIASSPEGLVRWMAHGLFARWCALARLAQEGLPACRNGWVWSSLLPRTWSRKLSVPLRSHKVSTRWSRTRNVWWLQEFPEFGNSSRGSFSAPPCQLNQLYRRTLSSMQQLCEVMWILLQGCAGTWFRRCHTDRDPFFAILCGDSWWGADWEDFVTFATNSSEHYS